ncbi:hypothetical protein BC941DRAFT_441941 [Chlamydoabsidia padenii]|nr:hypothetical protein BC941DRAFT_441941 [Chlamydoabsidia padenii]
MVNNFIISPKFSETAKILDNKRLGKQRVETFQIINILDRKNKKSKKRVGFINHPAVKSWEGHSEALKQYCNAMLEEWENRGFQNNMKYYPVSATVEYPKWIYCDKIHMSHKARLVQKDFQHYSPLFPEVLGTEYMKRGYIWPNKWTLDQLNTLSIQELTEELPLEERCVVAAACTYRASILTTTGWSCKIHARGLELVDNTCIAEKKDGSLCQNKRKFDEFCGVHRSLKKVVKEKEFPIVKEDEPSGAKAKSSKVKVRSTKEVKDELPVVKEDETPIVETKSSKKVKVKTSKEVKVKSIKLEN